ncbi:alpha-ketoacid dehydrogenase subunit beta [Glaciibacter superstes]|uniref:alpha-ketoacid dehydrogenase subunit beta n=1 Tax=Glaciibacter superstes TaxID=501023 RepID=UPI0003B76D3F|nr:alpha-ketoacid dehydrogenase subunit beta [Glaciibacter superstes]
MSTNIDPARQESAGNAPASAASTGAPVTGAGVSTATDAETTAGGDAIDTGTGRAPGSSATVIEPEPGKRKLSTAKAIQEAIAQEMRADDSVFVMGEDVGPYGGIFSSTTGLIDEFGADRILDTPISESAFIGAGIGAAVEGMRPIVELMFVDFFGVCMDQIYNHMAKIHFESGGNVQVPMVLMTAVGGGYSDGAQHSQALWGTFAHLPGMKVVVPSNPYDAKGLMTAAIRSNDPVVFMFHKGVMGLGWMKKNKRSIGAVPEESYEVPIGKARVVREGTDVTVVTLSLSVHHALDVAEKLEPEGISVEVLDLRSLVPLDRDAIVASVSKTGRLIVVDEDYQSFGLSGEVIASVAERQPQLLSHVSRVCMPDVPVPYASQLEYAVLPTATRIEAAVREAVAK